MLNLIISQSQGLFVNEVPIRASTVVSNGVIYVVNEVLMNFTADQRPPLAAVAAQPIVRQPSARQPKRLFADSQPISRVDEILSQKRRESLVELLERMPNVSRFLQLVKRSNYSRILGSESAELATQQRNYYLIFSDQTRSNKSPIPLHRRHRGVHGVRAGERRVRAALVRDAAPAGPGAAEREP